MKKKDKMKKKNCDYSKLYVDAIVSIDYTLVSFRKIFVQTNTDTHGAGPDPDTG